MQKGAKMFLMPQRLIFRPAHCIAQRRTQLPRKRESEEEVAESVQKSRPQASH